MDGLTPLLLDAKREYLSQLAEVLAPHVLNTMQAAYVSATKTQRNARRVLVAFQEKLREIPVWNASVVAAKTAEITSRAPFLADLIAAVFVSYTKILSSIKLGADKPNIRLRLPSNDQLVHQVYIHVAKEFYASPTLLRAERAVRAATVRAAVDAAVRSMLPIQDILKAYLGNSVDGEDQTMNADPGADEDEQMDEPQDVDDEPQEMTTDEDKHILTDQQFAPQQQQQFAPQQQQFAPQQQQFAPLQPSLMAAAAAGPSSLMAMAAQPQLQPADPFPQAPKRPDLFADAEDGVL